MRHGRRPGRALVLSVGLSAFFALARPAVAEPEAPSGSASDAASSDLPVGHQPDIDLTASAREVAVGDALWLTLRATVPRGDEVEVTRQPFGAFELLHKQAKRHIEGGREVFTFRLELLALRPGDHVVGPVELRLITKEGALATVSSGTVRVEVRSRLKKDAEAQPRPPVGPVALKQVNTTLLWVLGGVVGLGLLGLGAFLLVRWRRRRVRSSQTEVELRPPWEVATLELARLHRERPELGDQEAFAGWVDAVSDTLRKYLGARFGFDGLESTTDEVVRFVAERASSVSDHVRRLLQTCDLIKFADEPPTADCEALAELCIEVVQETKPHEERPPTETEAAP